MLMHASLTLWQILFTHIYSHSLTDTYANTKHVYAEPSIIYNTNPSYTPFFTSEHYKNVSKLLRTELENHKKFIPKRFPHLLLYEVVAKVFCSAPSYPHRAPSWGLFGNSIRFLIHSNRHRVPGPLAIRFGNFECWIVLRPIQILSRISVRKHF